jgi:hypothetical protein
MLLPNIFFSGLVDKLISGVENTVFDTKKHGRKFMDNFLKKVCINTIYLNVHQTDYEKRICWSERRCAGGV